MVNRILPIGSRRAFACLSISFIEPAHVLLMSRLTFLFVLSRLTLSRLNLFDPINGMHASSSSAVGLRPPFLPHLCSLVRSHPEPRGATLPSADVLSISRDTADRYAIKTEFPWVLGSPAPCYLKVVDAWRRRGSAALT